MINNPGSPGLVCHTHFPNNMRMEAILFQVDITSVEPYRRYYSMLVYSTHTGRSDINTPVRHSVYMTQLFSYNHFAWILSFYLNLFSTSNRFLLWDMFLSRDCEYSITGQIVGDEGVIEISTTLVPVTVQGTCSWYDFHNDLEDVIREIGGMSFRLEHSSDVMVWSCYQLSQKTYDILARSWSASETKNITSSVIVQWNVRMKKRSSCNGGEPCCTVPLKLFNGEDRKSLTRYINGWREGGRLPNLPLFNPWPVDSRLPHF